jgi:hypothetical protein
MNKIVFVQAHNRKIGFCAKSSVERLQIDEDRFVDDTQCVIDAYNNDGYKVVSVTPINQPAFEIAMTVESRTSGVLIIFEKVIK